MHREFLRSAVLDVTRIIPATTCPQRNEGERYSRYIASSNFPQFDLNFNTGEPEGVSTHSRVATNTVYVDQARTSHVLLPLMPTVERR